MGKLLRGLRGTRKRKGYDDDIEELEWIDFDDTYDESDDEEDEYDDEYDDEEDEYEDE